MLSTYLQARAGNPALARAGAILGFAALTAVGARLTVELPFTPVPITLQVLAALLAGLALGARDGGLSQVIYLAAFTAGLPVDAGGLGTAAWLRPSAGYLAGFPAGAFVAGWVAEHGGKRNWVMRFAAALAGIGVIYAAGATWLTIGFLGGNWVLGWAQGIAPFIAIDTAKAVVAAGVAEGLRAVLKRMGWAG
jgi:biotin transport system substrate-specific component